jgi:Ca2+-binding RTX toxin-like protein
MQEFIVSTLEDENDGNHDVGDLSLREAIALSNDNEGEDTINFDSNLSGGTIALTQTEPTPRGGGEFNDDFNITDSVNIVGLGANNITIDGLNGGNGIFEITGENTNVNLEGLTIANGDHARFFLSDPLPGGAIDFEGANLTVKDSVITGSDATLGGAINNSGNASIINSTITDSSGIDDSVPGGVIYNTGTLNISNSTISDNRSRGVANSGTLEVNNSSVSDNFGGGVFNSNSAAVTSSIIANNTSSDVTFTTVTPGTNTDDDVVGTEAFASGGNNLIGRVDGFGSFGFDSGNAAGFVNGENGDIVGTTDNPIDPNLGELQDNGGATQTQELLAGSPAIDAGSNPDGLATDQRGEGFDRTVGNGTDIGAFEVQTTHGGGGTIPDELVVSTLEDESDGDFGAGDLSLREAIALANEQEGADAISFDSNLSGGTIAFAESQEGNLAINDSVSINGLGQDNLTLDGGFIFNIAADTDVAIDGLNITGGKIDSFGNLTLTNSTLSQTLETGSSDNSSIISRGTAIISDSAIRDNSGGGKVGILVESGTAAISNSTVANNEAVLGRAGILIDSDATVDISNSTVANNQARSNAGIDNSGTVEITNSTIANNNGGLAAGGLINDNDISNAANAKVTGSIIANNNLTSTPIGDVSGDGEFISGGNNLISNGDDATGFIESDIVGTDAQPIDPQLGELQNNGGSTPTQELLAGSPAIDTGSNPDGLATDQRGEGFARTVGNGTDIGAFEVQTTHGGGGTNVPDIVGTAGGDVIDGTEESDLILGLDGNDTIRSLGGNDTVQGDNGNDSLEGGAGDDFLDGVEGFDSLFGGDGNDTLNGGIGNDSLDGGAGNDQIVGLEDRDTLLGGIGNDALEGNGGVDSLSGGEGDDNLFGLDDNDSLFGGAGNDLLDGGLGIDSLSGDAGDDRLFGLEDNDSLLGDNGNDLLDGGLGSDSLRGDNGNDTFVISSNAGTDTIADFNSSNDLIGLSSEINFADLSFSGNNIIFGTETIATLNGIDTANLTESNFVEV